MAEETFTLKIENTSYIPNYENMMKNKANSQSKRKRKDSQYQLWYSFSMELVDVC
ncbi:unnamed protein product, partial [Arabidopsis halleri]